MLGRCNDRLTGHLTVVQLDRNGGTFMGRPARLDSPEKITLSLSAICHKQMIELCEHFEAEPGRRQAMTRSEVVERAVAAMHQAKMPPKNKARR
jgi:hypothetical protein